MVTLMGKEGRSDLEELEARFWIGNKRASELWSQIGPELKRDGWTWPKFLRLLRLRPDLIVLFEIGKVPFNGLRDQIQEASEGRLGEILLEREADGR